MLRNLSELLSDMKALEEEYQRVSNEMEECIAKETLLTDLGLAMDCIECSLMYGDYINDTGKEYDYYNN